MSDRQCEFWTDDMERCTNPARHQVQPSIGKNKVKLWSCIECYDKAIDGGVWEEATYD